MSLRSAFEAKCFAYYAQLKAAGWSHSDEGDMTPESLFWRDEKNREMYGVRQIEAAWQGYQMAATPMPDDDDTSAIDWQFDDLMDGMGASEDHIDMRNALSSIGVKAATIELMMVALAHSKILSRLRETGANGGEIEATRRALFSR